MVVMCKWLKDRIMAGTFSDGPSLPRSEDSGLGEILEKKAYTATDTAMEEEQMERKVQRQVHSNSCQSKDSQVRS